ncbi:hypothetical protein ACFL0H_00340 [Thermodesulfobacteriota bacterium]
MKIISIIITIVFLLINTPTTIAMEQNIEQNAGLVVAVQRVDSRKSGWTVIIEHYGNLYYHTTIYVPRVVRGNWVNILSKCRSKAGLHCRYYYNTPGVSTWKQILPYPTDHRGCCSHHGGIAYCDRNVGRIVCNDGNYSPTCT